MRLSIVTVVSLLAKRLPCVWHTRGPMEFVLSKTMSNLSVIPLASTRLLVAKVRLEDTRCKGEKGSFSKSTVSSVNYGPVIHGQILTINSSII